MDRILDAALRMKADAVHAGWGFLAENAAFARRVIDAGLTWIGPPPEVIRRMGDKIEAKRIAARGAGPRDPGDRPRHRGRAGPPLDARGARRLPGDAQGGRGRRRARHGQGRARRAPAHGDRPGALRGQEVLRQRDRARREVRRARPAHRVQIVADAQGNVVHLYERECTIQRRNQKIVEEAPSPTLDAELRDEICETAVRLMREIGYAFGRHRGVPLRLGDAALLFPRGQHPAAGRARHHRADHRRRHRRLDARRGRGQEAALLPEAHPPQPLGARGAPQRRGPAQLQSVIRQHLAPGRPAGAKCAHRLRRLRGADVPPTTTRC